jgi:hypothetical protein
VSTSKRQRRRSARKFAIAEVPALRTWRFILRYDLPEV